MSMFLTELYYGTLLRLRREEEGQTLVEYGLILVLVSLAVIVLLTALGVDIKGVFQDSSTELKKRPS